MIHPGEKLSEVGKTNGWSQMLPDRPYQNKFGALMATLRQMLGFR